MPKRFDCEDEPNEFMEAPCRCDCGNWFDLDDGHRSERKQNRIVCRECAEDEKALHVGDTVRFNDEFVVSGRTKAYCGDEAEITKVGVGRVSVKIDGKKLQVHGVPISLLEKLY